MTNVFCFLAKAQWKKLQKKLVLQTLWQLSKYVKPFQIWTWLIINKDQMQLVFVVFL